MALSKFIGKIKNLGASPQQAASLVTPLFLVIVLLVINLALLPTVFKIFSLLIFLALIFLILREKIKFTELSTKSSFQNKEFRTIIENLKEGVIAYNPDFKILDINRAAEEILGLNREEVVGKTVEPGLVKNPHFTILVQIIFPSLASSVNQISTDTWPQVINLTIDNPPLRLRTILNPILDESGKTIGFIKLIRDETREKEIIRSKSEFIAVAAHELRTPLTGIHWSFETLLNEEKDAKKKQLLNEGFKLAEHSLKVINDLLDVAKIEEGRFGYKWEDVDLIEIIEKVVDQSRVLAKEYGVRLYSSSDKNQYNLKADPSRLGIALANLIDNAIRYNVKNGSVSIITEAVPGKPFVRVSVKDTGVGVPKEETGKLFTKFYRGTNVVQIEPNGSGLGLYIAKNIINRHGGEVGVESTIGRGSVFWFTLPLDPKLIPVKELTHEEEM